MPATKNRVKANIAFSLRATNCASIGTLPNNIANSVPPFIPLRLSQQHHVDWRWVRGHAGDPGNERADALANRGAAEHVK